MQYSCKKQLSPSNGGTVFIFVRNIDIRFNDFNFYMFENTDKHTNINTQNDEFPQLGFSTIICKKYVFGSNIYYIYILYSLCLLSQV